MRRQHLPLPLHYDVHRSYVSHMKKNPGKSQPKSKATKPVRQVNQPRSTRNVTTFIPSRPARGTIVPTVSSTQRLGSTPQGAEWVKMALSPCTAVTPMSWPDDSGGVSTVKKFTQCVTLNPAAFGVTPQSGTTWTMEITLLPSPVVFASCTMWYRTASDISADKKSHRINAPGDEAEAHLLLLNTQLSDTVTAEACWDALRTLAEDWRLAGASITIQQTAPMTASQGVIKAIQYPLEAREYHCTVPNQATPTSALGDLFMSQNISVYDNKDIPGGSEMMVMPRAYRGLAIDGLYQVLRLHPVAQDWTSEYNATGFIKTVASEEAILNGWEVLPDAVSTDVWPYWGLDSMHWTKPTAVAQNAPVKDVVARPSSRQVVAQNQPQDLDATASTAGGTMLPALCNKYVGRTLIEGSSLEASYVLTIHQIYEFQVRASSHWSMDIHAISVYDPEAIRVYHQLNRAMMDAYPASYNDLGQIWDAISGFAKSVIAPAVSLIPGFGAPIAAGIEGVAGLGDTIRGALK